MSHPSSLMNTIQRILILPSVIFMASVGLAQQASPAAGNSAVIPTPRTEAWAIAGHESLLANSRTNPNMQVVFLGDSITHGLQFGLGAAVWREYFAPLNALAFALPGDKTQNILWRITEGGELNGLHPKVVVVLIGINNLTSKNTPEETAAGIAAIVHEIESGLPGARILLMGVFPCWERDSVQKTNAIIAKLEDLKQVYFLNIGDKFIAPDGTIPKSVLKDGIHPSEEGYQIMAKAMQPYLNDLLKNEGNGELWKKRVDGKPAN